MTDTALDIYLNGHYGLPGQGFAAPDYMRNPVIAVSVSQTGPLSVTIAGPTPLLVEQVNEPLLPVETALAPLGVIKDAVTGAYIGRVMVSRNTNELTGVVTETVTAYYEDGTTVANYIGPWAVEGDCSTSTPAGVLPTWG